MLKVYIYTCISSCSFVLKTLFLKYSIFHTEKILNRSFPINYRSTDTPSLKREVLTCQLFITLTREGPVSDWYSVGKTSTPVVIGNFFFNIIF